MLSSKFIILVVAILSMIVLSAPAAEGTFLLACLFRSPLCPFFRYPTPAPPAAPKKPKEEPEKPKDEPEKPKEEPEKPKDDAGKPEDE
uniref:Putative secreted protein n=1 Tax=Haematobia irritans TaxID=7368 RepID=A0A1L8E732_HAEIR